MKVAVIGYGSRGQYYARLFQEKKAEVVACCDINTEKLNIAGKVLNISADNLFESEDEFFAKGKLADLLIVSTQDSDHYGHAIKAMNAGYDLLLEKPVATTIGQCVEIQKTAEKSGRKVFVCHVLRYAPFFTLIKKELNSGKYGKIVTINHTENVAYWHQAHSYVRGNWRRSEGSTPMIIAKCCHDLDLIVWFMGAKCKRVSSYGSLDFYTEKHAPEGSSAYCYDCRYVSDCPYSAERIYIKDRAMKGHLGWPCDTIIPEPTVEKLREALKRGPYGRCVYRCDNDVVDHQVVNMEFENGSTAHLTMTAFGEHSRVVHYHCEKGEIFGEIDSNIIHCSIFGGEKYDINVSRFADVFDGHGGGDSLMVDDVINSMNGKPSFGLTAVSASMQSHIIGFKAEESRLNGGESIDLTDFNGK